MIIPYADDAGNIVGYYDPANPEMGLLQLGPEGQLGYVEIDSGAFTAAGPSIQAQSPVAAPVAPAPVDNSSIEAVLGRYNQSNFDIGSAANAMRVLGNRYGLTDADLMAAIPVFGDYHRSLFNSGYTEGSNYNQIALSAVQDALKAKGQDPGVVASENPNFVSEGANAAQERWQATQEKDDGLLGGLGPLAQLAALIPGPQQPFLLGLNAVNSASQGNLLGTVLNGVGLAGNLGAFSNSALGADTTAFEAGAANVGAGYGSLGADTTAFEAGAANVGAGYGSGGSWAGAPVVEMGSAYNPASEVFNPSLGNQVAGITGSGALGNLGTTVSGAGTVGSAIGGLLGGNGSVLGTVLGGVLGATNGAEEAGTTTTTQDIPDWLKPYATSLLNTGQTFVDQATANPYDYTQADNTLNGFMNMTANPYAGQTNPYFEDTLNLALNDTQGRVNAQFGNGNAFGNSANQELLGTNLGNQANALRYGQYTNAQNLWQQDANRATSIAQGMPNYNTAKTSAQFAPLTTQRGLFTSGTQTTTPYYTNPVAGALSGGLLGSQLFGGR